ncbi:MAG: metal-dependent phosphohydrolase [Chloroflexi bacterium]|nr:metal-dependent phosphohydrolase [Chloroflexota bacterium]
MLNLQRLLIQHFVKELKGAYQQTYGLMKPELGNFLEWTGRLSLENIANSDILYHNIEHTIMVTLVGQAILQGKHLREGGISPQDWLQFMVALLCHDIGYIKGVCRQDGGNLFATGIGNETVVIPPEGTDAALTPYHVDRSKLFVRERFSDQLQNILDIDLVTSYIEMTRFPIPDDDFYKDTRSYRGLARAADFIGQLGDPNYLRKTPALFYEFEEIGTNETLGYQSPGDMRRQFTKFYYGVVRPRIQDALVYLRVTQEGKQWIANLHSHVFEVENS